MSMKRIGILFCLVLWVFISCQNEAEPVQTKAPGTSQGTAAGRPPEQAQQAPAKAETTSPAPSIVAFDPSSVTREERETTMTDIQHLIERLNGIIRAKNYNAWVSNLSPNYFALISSPEYLDRISQSNALTSQKIVLKSAQDYFTYVVVPSRTNDRVDDIEFESRTRVKAYTINNRGERLRLYDLERTGNEWKIVN